MTSADVPHRPLVTIAALYGAGGSVVGPRVAQRLGVPFLDRQIPDAVAAHTGLPETAVDAVAEEPRSGIDRLAASLGRLPRSAVPPADRWSGSCTDHRLAFEVRKSTRLASACPARAEPCAMHRCSTRGRRLPEAYAGLGTSTQDVRHQLISRDHSERPRAATEAMLWPSWPRLIK